MAYEMEFVGEYEYAGEAEMRNAISSFNGSASLSCSPITFEHLQKSGRRIRIEVTGSFPATMYEAALGVLGALSKHASGGAVEARWLSEEESSVRVQAGMSEKEALQLF